MVLRAVRDHQIVILNESHFHPEHRALGARILPQLHSAGLRYLALETDNQRQLDTAIHLRRVTPQTDYYSFEPRRAGLIRSAIASDLKIVAFDFQTADELVLLKEDPIRSMSIREDAMARNIQEIILHRDPSAKVLIWVGMGHAVKNKIEGQAFMARRLWERTGIEPFSIYQVSIDGPSEEFGPLIKEAAGQGAFSSPLAVRLPLKSLAASIPTRLIRNPVYREMLKFGIDAIILHPPMAPGRDAERPLWLRQEGTATIRGTVYRGAAPAAECLVQAIPAEEGESATPSDQVETDHAGKYTLYIPPGRYILCVKILDSLSGQERTAGLNSELTCKTRQVIERDLDIH